MIVDIFRTVAGWPLRQFGLESGHAIANANPSAERTRAAQIEQIVYVTSRLAADDENVAVLSRPTHGDKPTNEVEILVFRGGKLIKLPLALDTDLLHAIYGT
jgi:hypothetical protein